MATTRKSAEKTTGHVASSAGRLLASKSASKEEKTLAASALAQRSEASQTSGKASKVASGVLRSSSATKEAKSLAASVLTQAPSRKK
jgi:hypothetical protein